MAVTNVILRKRQGKATLSGGKRVRTYQAIYYVKCNSINEDPVTIWGHPEIPTLYPISSWPTDPGALLVDVDPQQQEETPDFWIVTCSYTSNPDIGKPEDVQENPLNRPAVIQRSPVQRQRIVERDVDGNLIINTAGEPFNPPVEREEHAPSFTITKNLANWPYAMELALTDAINSSPIVYVSRGISYGARLVKCNGFSGGESYENGINFWAVSVALEVNWDGWNPDKLNAGFREKYTDEFGEKYLWPITGANGESVSEPVLLDSLGRSDPYRDPIYLPCKKHRETSFAGLFALFGIT
jgi:hypothetical protein